MSVSSNPDICRGYALYASFAASTFGGSHVGVVSDASRIPAEIRQRIAVELGAPATCFVDDIGNRAITVQFFSTVKELPMCGHGTIGLMTRAVEQGWVDLNGEREIDIALVLPKAPTNVRISRNADGRTRVMVSIPPASLRTVDIDLDRLAAILGISVDDFHRKLPVEIADGDFTHLVVPMHDLAAVRRISPDFGPIITFCHDHGIDTIAAISTETEQAESSIHVRDFCPAVGVAESPAAGTTNAALTSYLVRHEVASADGDGRAIVIAEQGMEIRRPSTIRSEAHIDGGAIASLRVGGTANKIVDGSLMLPVSTGSAGND